jgi:hypothetical protein
VIFLSRPRPTLFSRSILPLFVCLFVCLENLTHYSSGARCADADGFVVEELVVLVVVVVF